MASPESYLAAARAEASISRDGARGTAARQCSRVSGGRTREPTGTRFPSPYLNRGTRRGIVQDEASVISDSAGVPSTSRFRPVND
jgi:hypothetical protein